MIDGSLCVEARLSLYPTESGGLQTPLPTGTRSLLLNFQSFESHDEQVQIGAVIIVMDANKLEPGVMDARVRLHFWADEATIYATPGATFKIWYGLVVGEGVVDRIVDEVADATSECVS